MTDRIASGESVARAALPAVGPGTVWIIDLDGVVWLSGTPIGDASGAVARLRGTGTTVAFATNNSAPTVADLIDRLRAVGIPAEPRDLVTSAQAAASLLRPGSRVRVLAEAGVVEALGQRGVTIAADGPVDAAVVGWSRHFDFDLLARIAEAARRSGRLIGTNEDPTHPTPGGLTPGTGALLAAVATASGVIPEVAGKPHAAMARVVRDRFALRSTDAVVVGDQPGTDGRLAQRLGVPFALVHSGVTPPEAEITDVPVAVRSEHLFELVDRAVGAGPGVAGGGPGRMPSDSSHRFA